MALVSAECEGKVQQVNEAWGCKYAVPDVALLSDHSKGVPVIQEITSDSEGQVRA